jgi:exodeoxyribonuclease VII large subunit
MEDDRAEVEGTPGTAGAAQPPEPDLPGPFAVGRYARELRQFLRDRPRLKLSGEVVNLGSGRGGHAYFELRDSDGAVPCAMWASDVERMRLADGALRDGVEVVIAGGPDFYAGSGSSSPRFSFRVDYLRLAGEGDLMAKLAALRKELRAEGLFEPQKRLPRPRLPRRIGVVTAEAGAARRDLVAGLERRGWRGTIVWGFAPVQDRHAAPRIIRAIQDLAAVGDVEAIVVCRGGGSLADLWAFCDETLCRTVALLAVPVISAVGHEVDSTLIDDVAAIACSTPTHAAEAVVPLDCDAARAQLPARAATLHRAGRSALGERSRHLLAAARVPGRHLDAHMLALHQRLREIRAAADRGVNERARADLARRTQTLRALDPERTLERGYALVEGPDEQPLSRASAAIEAERVAIRFADGKVAARVEDGGEDD